MDGRCSSWSCWLLAAGGEAGTLTMDGRCSSSGPLLFLFFCPPGDATVVGSPPMLPLRLGCDAAQASSSCSMCEGQLPLGSLVALEPCRTAEATAAAVAAATSVDLGGGWLLSDILGGSSAFSTLVEDSDCRPTDFLFGGSSAPGSGPFLGFGCASPVEGPSVVPTPKSGPFLDFGCASGPRCWPGGALLDRSSRRPSPWSFLELARDCFPGCDV